ncbi:MAG TPA: patatin-like phospholipase family protein [Kofleriaceae bacterium]
MTNTLGDWLAREPFALAMSSGFFSFFAHTGMLDALTSRGLSPARVSGSSAGALVAGAWAAGLPAAALASRLQGLQRGDFWDPAPGAGLLAGRRFDRLLRDMLPATALAACAVPVQISVFDIVRRATAVLASPGFAVARSNAQRCAALTDDGDLVHAIRASCAVPGLFHPVWIARRAYWDGGILDRPGLAGLPAGARVLHHHIASRSPWRRTLEVPRRPGMVTLALAGLPRSGPFRLEAGRRALELAREATLRALDAPVPANGCVTQHSS